MLIGIDLLVNVLDFRTFRVSQKSPQVTALPVKVIRKPSRRHGNIMRSEFFKRKHNWLSWWQAAHMPIWKWEWWSVFSSLIVPIHQWQKQQPAEASRNILSSKMLQSTVWKWFNGWMRIIHNLYRIWSCLELAECICIPCDIQGQKGI